MKKIVSSSVKNIGVLSTLFFLEKTPLWDEYLSYSNIMNGCSDSAFLGSPKLVNLVAMFHQR